MVSPIFDISMSLLSGYSEFKLLAHKEFKYD